jgi:GDP-4-dehydro-6-deoxy-D-mannose reductase
MDVVGRTPMRRTLVTGAGGMVGSHLLERLAVQAPGSAIGTSFRPTVRIEEFGGRVALAELDVRDRDAVRAMFVRERPDVIYHLAAQSLPTVSWTDPWETMRTNVEGTVNVFEAIRDIRARGGAGYDPMVVVACSSAQYGASLTPENVPIAEETAPLPLHPYGVSKVAQDLLAFQYWRNDRIRSIRARIFNTTGPRKRADVVSDFCARVARIARHGGALRVGNLETRRAILDVRDLVAALILLAERGEPGEAYNICADRAWRIGELIPMLEELSGVALTVAPDPALFRPSDEPVILGRNTKLKERTGWQPTVELKETLRAVLAYEMAHPAP